MSDDASQADDASQSEESIPAPSSDHDSLLSILDKINDDNDNSDEKTQLLQEETTKLLQRVKENEEKTDSMLSLMTSSQFFTTSSPKKSSAPYHLKFQDGETFKRSISKLSQNNETKLTETEFERELQERRARSRSGFVTRMHEKNLDQVKIHAQV